MFRIQTESPDDSYEVEYLFDLCFAPGRSALSSYRLREDVPPVSELCLTIRDDFDSISAAIRYWPVRIGKCGHPALLLGPVAVHPTRQGEGVGSELILSSLGKAKDLGWSRVILVGDEPYYSRVGFSTKLARGISFPPPTNPERLLAHALKVDAFRGVTGRIRKWK